MYEMYVSAFIFYLKHNCSIPNVFKATFTLYPVFFFASKSCIKSFDYLLHLIELIQDLWHLISLKTCIHRGCV